MEAILAYGGFVVMAVGVGLIILDRWASSAAIAAWRAAADRFR